MNSNYTDDDAVREKDDEQAAIEASKSIRLFTREE